MQAVTQTYISNPFLLTLYQIFNHFELILVAEVTLKLGLLPQRGSTVAHAWDNNQG